MHTFWLTLANVIYIFIKRSAFTVEVKSKQKRTTGLFEPAKSLKQTTLSGWGNNKSRDINARTITPRTMFAFVLKT